jgi:hypothetical protein
MSSERVLNEERTMARERMTLILRGCLWDVDSEVVIDKTWSLVTLSRFRPNGSLECIEAKVLSAEIYRFPE